MKAAKRTALKHGPLSDTSAIGRISPLTGAKAMCARLVGRSCEFGTNASLEGAAVVIKTGRPALGFG
jgi:hypothetical protein